LNHRAEDYAPRKEALTIMAAGAAVKEVGTGTGFEKSGKD